MNQLNQTMQMQPMDDYVNDMYPEDYQNNSGLRMNHDYDPVMR